MTTNMPEIEILNGDDRLLSKSEVAIYLGVSAATLDRWDATRSGPPRIVVGRQVRYRRSALMNWLRARED